jgi:hypothetical protein
LSGKPIFKNYFLKVNLRIRGSWLYKKSKLITGPFLIAIKEVRATSKQLVDCLSDNDGFHFKEVRISKQCSGFTCILYNQDKIIWYRKI